MCTRTSSSRSPVASASCKRRCSRRVGSATGGPSRSAGSAATPATAGACTTRWWSAACPMPEPYYTLETLIPMLSVYAPDLAREHLDALLRGDEAWCQGFSEPDAGSDLASLRTKAVRDGDDWVISGHKIWTSQASVAQRCVALVRTGTPESRHRGLSMMLVDHDTPGVTVRPIRAMTGRDEFGEVLFDDVRVGGDRLIGERGRRLGDRDVPPAVGTGHVPVAAPSRAARPRSTALLADHADRLDPGELADAYLAVLPMRVSSRNTIRRLVAGENPGPEVSVDKVLLARAEVAVHDLADAVLDARDRAGRRLGRRGLAPRLPLQPGGADLRRLDRDPADDPRRPRARAAREADDGRPRSGDARPLRAHGAQRVRRVRRRPHRRARRRRVARHPHHRRARGRAARVPSAGRAPGAERDARRRRGRGDGARVAGVARRARPGFVRAPGTPKRGGGARRRRRPGRRRHRVA